MSGYRIRSGGPAAVALWLLVMLADAAWVTSTTAMVFGALAIVTVAALFVLVARITTPPRQPVRVRVPARH
jgi:hypothetical protein